jgi:glycosyltransferase involved in cell wall biosynthesis
VEPHLLEARYAFASRYLAILESMASRRLTFALATDPLRRAYLEDFPGAGQAFILAASSDELAREFERLLRNPEESKGRIELAFAIASRASWHTMALQYLGLYARASLDAGHNGASKGSSDL